MTPGLAASGILDLDQTPQIWGWNPEWHAFANPGSACGSHSNLRLALLLRLKWYLYTQS